VSIKWSAVKVSEATDAVEQQVLLASQFINEAKAKAKEAKNIVNLPEYMEQRLTYLIIQLERMENIQAAIESVRQDIPGGAIEEEQDKLKYGSQQSLV
jgi:hypothetical protein